MPQSLIETINNIVVLYKEGKEIYYGSVVPQGINYTVASNWLETLYARKFIDFKIDGVKKKILVTDDLIMLQKILVLGILLYERDEMFDKKAQKSIEKILLYLKNKESKRGEKK